MTDVGRQFWKRLTPREREIVMALCESTATASELGRELGLGGETLKRHMSNICDKAGMSSRLELAFFCWSNGVVSCPCGRSRAQVDVGC